MTRPLILCLIGFLLVQTAAYLVMGVVIQKIRDSARGEACTFCKRQDDTVVFCHGPRLDFAGKGQKTDDWWGAYGCFTIWFSETDH